MISRLTSLTRLVLIAGCVVLGVACSGPSSQPECNDGVDNDHDGFIDANDPGCVVGDTEVGDPLVACNDTIDNDDDGLIDFPEDPGCQDVRDNDEFNVRDPQCMDGEDNDGDGHIDFPNDPGCFNANQDNELDDCPNGENCPECGDGQDNDFDGDTDYPADDGCASASSPAEFMADANACGTGTVIANLVITGSTAMVADVIPNTGASNIQSATCNGRGTERAYLFTIDHPVTMVATTDAAATTVNTVLYIRRNCMQAATEVTCNDDISATNNHSRLTANLQPGTYYLIVDGRDLASSGAFEMQVHFFEAPGGECTDQSSCSTGYVCRTVPAATVMTCELPVCSDSRDDDADGHIDFPADPGCTSLTDDTETDTCPAGPGCPACGDGADNDLDGNTDFPMDPNCASASAASEADCPLETDALIPITGPLSAGTTVGASNSLTPICGSSSHTAPERVHLLNLGVTVQQLDVVVAPTGSWDAATSMMDVNCGTTLFCSDPNTFTRNNLPPGRYPIVVDGFSSGSGAYTLSVHGVIGLNGLCNDPLVAAGVLTCAPNSTCTGTPGQEHCVPAVCNDTIDADGDGFPGFPTDPGCTSIADNDETDDCPGGPGCPACGNELDDDGDGDFDFPMDIGCTSASGTFEECLPTIPIVPFTGGVIGATTAGHLNSVDLSCGTDGRDTVYRLRLTAPLSEFRANTLGSATDTILAVKRGGCSTFDLQCDDNSAGGTASAVFLIDLDPGDYYLIVDDKNVGSPSTYNLNVSGLYANGAACDPTSTLFTCNPGLICAGATPTCRIAACNDAVDEDGDGFNGFPTDPGCNSVNDNDETDACPNGPGCPVCSDDLDNDLDTFNDYPLDPQCTSAGADSESAPCVSTDAVPIFTGNVSGRATAGHAGDVTLTCGTNGRDDVYRLFVTQPLVSLTADTNGSPMPTAVAIRRTTCNGTTDLSCGTNNSGDGDGSASISAVTAGEYFVIVDDLGIATPSTYDLHVTGRIAAGNTCNPASQNFICVAGNACYGPAGAETCQIAACNDATDADGDGFNGFPSDPGCASSSDNDEADNCPSGPGCPACSDDLDNDGDGRIDYPLDLGCTAASVNNEVECQLESEPLLPITTPATNGTTAGAINNLRSTCGSTTSFTAPDRVHIMEIRVPLATLHVDTTPVGFDQAITLSDATCGNSISCAHAGPINVSNVTPGTYTILVDGFSTASGTYTLNVAGTIASGGSCEDPLVTSGVLTCAVGNACAGTPGARTCVPAACNDAIDADGDGFVGFPTDPGCASPGDNDETDNCPAGPGCPACGDHLDNDGDGLNDYPADFGCESASGPTEVSCLAETDPIFPITGPVTTGTTVGATNNFTPPCQTSTLGDRVFILRLQVPVATLVMDTEGSTLSDTVLMFMTSTCALPPIACDDDSGVLGSGLESVITRSNVTPGNYAVEVDHYAFAGTSGPFLLNIHGTLPAGGSCNDPLVAAGVLACPSGQSCQAGTCAP